MNMYSHPWRASSFERRVKLAEARKTAKRIYERTSPVRNDEYATVKQRERIRAAKGIPVDLPKMKPWDFKKGKLVVGGNPKSSFEDECREFFF